MLDTARLSLSHPGFALPTGRRSRRDLVDFFASIAWSWEVAVRSGAAPLVGLVEWHAGESECTESLKRRHRQWSERFRGRRSPSAKLIDEMEARCPGSAATWQLALWPALRIELPLDAYVSAVAQQLPSKYRRTLTNLVRPDPMAIAKAVHAYRQPVIDMALSASLDDLACMLVLLRLGIERGGDGIAKVIAESLFVVLLVQALWLADHGLLVPMAEYIEARFFSRVIDPWVGYLNVEGFLHAEAGVAARMGGEHLEMAGPDRYDAWKVVALKAGYTWDLFAARQRLKERQERRARYINAP